MTVTAAAYNHYTRLITSQTLNIANMKLMLLKNTHAFNPTLTSVDAVAGAASPNRVHEFYGNGWPQGGKTVTDVAATIVSTNDAKLSGGQVTQTASGGSIGPCRYVLLYEATLMQPLIIYDLGQDEYAGDTTDFKFTFDLTGTPGTIYNLNV